MVESGSQAYYAEDDEKAEMEYIRNAECNA
jgi:hypothetical protein